LRASWVDPGWVLWVRELWCGRRLTAAWSAGASTLKRRAGGIRASWCRARRAGPGGRRSPPSGGVVESMPSGVPVSWDTGHSDASRGQTGAGDGLRPRGSSPLASQRRGERQKSFLHGLAVRRRRTCGSQVGRMNAPGAVTRSAVPIPPRIARLSSPANRAADSGAGPVVTTSTS
jgi:hypothetical protein